MTSFEESYKEILKDELKDDFSLTVLEYALNPRNRGSMENADSYARVTGPCGDTMEIWLTAENNKITQAAFETDGCLTTIAAGSMVTELVKGKKAGEALQIEQQTILEALGGLPEESEHCALLAANAMKGALSYLLLNGRT
jgi:nitrogen fixation NifU-like protein